MAAIGRLGVILAADVVDYSSLIGADREGALERLEAHRRQLINPKIAEHCGRIVRATGDSLLVEFASPADAARCAVEVQRGMIDRNLDTAPDRRIAFRVGINIGEVTTSGGDLVSRAVAALPIDELATLIKPRTEIYGAGVNIAALIVALAEPGGICISGAVRDAIRDELPYQFKDIGRRNLDLRAAPVHCYALSAASVAGKPRIAAQYERAFAGRPIRLRSAVVALGVFATVGVWAVALWTWLGTASPTAPVPASVAAASHMPSAGSAADKDPRAPQRPQPTLATNTADLTTRAPSAPQSPLVSDTVVDRGSQTPPARATPPDIGAAVVRGKQASAAPEATTDGGTAVVRGKTGQSASQNKPDIGTAVVRGSQVSAAVQGASDAGAEVIRGTRAPSRPAFSTAAQPGDRLSNAPNQE